MIRHTPSNSRAKGPQRLAKLLPAAQQRTFQPLARETGHTVNDAPAASRSGRRVSRTAERRVRSSTAVAAEEPLPTAAAPSEPDPDPGLTLGQMMAEYAAFLRCEANSSETTRKTYASNLRRFGRSLAGEGYPELPLRDIEEAHLRDYQYGLVERGCRPRTVRGAMFPLRGMFDLAVSRGYLAANLAKAVKLPKKDAALRIVATDEELFALLGAAERERDELRRVRMTAVLSVFIYAAVRRQELLDLRLEDIDLTRKKLLVRNGKGSKSRCLTLCAPCVDALRTWIALRPTTDHSYLFLADRSRRLGDVGLKVLLDDSKALADLRDRHHIQPHSMRHACATRMHRNGATVRELQYFLGHQDIRTTALYLHVDETELEEIAEFASLDQPRRGRTASTSLRAVAGTAQRAGRRANRSVRAADCPRGRQRFVPQ